MATKSTKLLERFQGKVKKTKELQEFEWDGLKLQMKGKCGGGKKLGVSLNFPSEDKLLEYINKNYEPCSGCKKIFKKKDLILTSYTSWAPKFCYACLH
jgi:hypothetical protein